VTSAPNMSLKPFGYHPGHYSCRCIDCPTQRKPQDYLNPYPGMANAFEGAKGSYRCEMHAAAAKAEFAAERADFKPATPPVPPQPDLRRLVDALEVALEEVKKLASLPVTK
jgi:hypothetical protein